MRLVEVIAGGGSGYLGLHLSSEFQRRTAEPLASAVAPDGVGGVDS